MYALTYIIFICLILCCLILYMWYKTTYSFWKVRNVPFINPLPVLGSVFPLYAGKISFGSLLYNFYKESNLEIQGFFTFHTPWLLLRNVDLIKSVFVKDFDYFADRAMMDNPRDDAIFSNTLFCLKGAQWKYMRSKMSVTMSPQRLKSFYPIINNIGNDLIDYIDHKYSTTSNVNARAAGVKYATSIFTQFSFGVESRPLKEDDDKFFNLGKEMFSQSYFKTAQMTTYLLSAYLVKLFRMKWLQPNASEFLRNVFWDVFNAAENKPELGGNVMQYMIQLKKQADPSVFSCEGDKLVAQSAQYFLAGLDTTSLTVSFALYELSINPEIQDRLRSEIKRYTTDWKNLSYEELDKIPYLDMVVNETLRKYPPFPFLDRVCIKEYTLPGTDVNIPVGTRMCVSLLGLHYDSRNFPDPHTFDPERFSKQNVRSSCYMPFSMGPRVCIGERLAIITIKVAIIKILSLFSIELAGNVSIKFSANSLMIIPIEDLNLKFTKIDS